MRDYLGVTLGDVAIAPIFWNVAPVLAVEAVKGIPTGGGSSQTWNIFEWDLARR